MDAVRPDDQDGTQETSLLRRRVTPGMVVLIVGAIVVLRLWVVETAIVDGKSMEDTLEPGDRVLVVKTAPIERGDVVVFRDPETNSVSIKRVIALPGDTIAFLPQFKKMGGLKILLGGRVYVNGKPFREPYISLVVPPKLGPTEMPEDRYFVMGDNRDESLDSRNYGPVPGDRIQGVAVAVVYPFGRARLVGQPDAGSVTAQTR